jgi:hypothetical protein
MLILMYYVGVRYFVWLNDCKGDCGVVFMEDFEGD